jgi:SOS response regulatory protein OraA/RecX
MEQDATEALDAAMRALRFRDLSAHDLRVRLEEKEFSSADCDAALESLVRTGLVDDGRFAENRARVLAGRGAGDGLIRHELERAGVDDDAIANALGTLIPEVERARAVAAARGRGPKAARYLYAKGFSEEAVSGAIATASHETLG